MNHKIFTFLIKQEDAGERLDVYLHKKCSMLSRSQIKRLIEDGQVTLNSKLVKVSHLLREKEEITLTLPPPKALELVSQAIPLDILYEDENLIVLNKAAEMVTHPGAGIQEGTLVNALLHHCKKLPGIGGVARPGIVHRLDKGTSGVMVVAKDDLAQHSLSEQFKSHEIEKKYLAFVWGNLRHLSGTIDMPLGRSTGDRKRISSKSKHTRHAITQYHVLQNWEGVSLLELTPLTGRTHQIRVHLAEMGHPIVGDPTYGKGLRRISALPKSLQEKLSGRPFQFLHASSLSFRHPRTGKRVNFSAPMREEMREFQKGLIKNENKSSKKGMSKIDYHEKTKK